MTQIDVERLSGPPPTLAFRVTLTGGGSSTHHDVRIPPTLLDLTRGYDSLEDFVRACFAFLLAREPKESILRSFDVDEIGRYFPGFEREIARR